MGLLYALCWPQERSLDLWVFKDRGSLLNLDLMLDQHLQLGVDTFYAYGLLPVLIQRVLFQAFGRGSWALIGCHLLALPLMAGAWTLIIRELRQPLLWAALVIVLTPIVVWVNPNFPYLLVQLSMMYALAFALRGNLRVALAISAIGCWSVPTVTLLFSAALLAAVCMAWRASPDPSLRSLVSLLAPGALAYGGLGLLLAGYFGWRSMLATALPLQGMAFYKSVHYGMFTSLKIFLHPGPAPFWRWSPLRYYVCDRASWWILGSLLLFGFATTALVRAIKDREPLRGADLVVVLCAFVHLSFILLAYGNPTQHVIYDFLIAIGVVLGLAGLQTGNFRNGLLGAFALVSLLSHLNQVGLMNWLWHSTSPSADVADFYAHDDFKKDWSEVLALSATQNLYLLSYGTGMQNYFPTVQVAPIWTVQIGEVFDSDKARLLDKLRGADIVVEDLTGPMTLFDMDTDIKRELSAMCLMSKGKYFITWSKKPRAEDGQCVSFHRELPSDIRQRGEFPIL